MKRVSNRQTIILVSSSVLTPEGHQSRSLSIYASIIFIFATSSFTRSYFHQSSFFLRKNYFHQSDFYLNKNSDDLRFNNHIQRLCCQARQSFYALRTLVAHGLRGPHLYDVVRATTLARMLYASPAWWGFVGQRDKDKFEALMRRLIRYHYLPGDSLSFEQLCIKADSRLFSSILADNGHVLHELLPPIKTSKYSLRPRAHDRIIPPADNLMRKTFITRMIYIRSDQDWLTFLDICGTIMYMFTPRCGWQLVY